MVASVALLEASNVVAGYGETEILHGVSIAVDNGEIVTIIGPNGCGKSTLMKVVVGLVRIGPAPCAFVALTSRDKTLSKPYGAGCATCRNQTTSFPQ